jgi:hypothetical protein
VPETTSPQKVHRELHVTTPFMEGPDVRALQQAVNRVAADFPRILAFQLDVDDQFGDETAQGCAKAAFLLGVMRRRIDDVEKRKVVDRRVQHVLRRPEIRTAAQKQRARRRREELRAKLDAEPTLDSCIVTATAGPQHWGGSNDPMTHFVEPFMLKRGLPLGSGKRTPAHNAAIGGSATSDHLTTKTTTAARDFPTFAGEDDARALAQAMGIDAWRPNDHTLFAITAGGQAFRVQILWGAAIDHGDHVHVGVSRA